MKSQWLWLISGLVALPILHGCDASSGGGGNTQEPDPVVVDFPIAYIERPIPRDEDGEFIPDDVMDITAFRPGARLLLKDRASVPADALVITDIAFSVPEIEVVEGEEISAELANAALRPRYDVKDLSVNPDGTKLLFTMRAPEIEDADEEDQPTWNIWEYDLESEMLRRIIDSDTIAEEGQDIMPAYLADGRIAFSSNRQRRSRAVLLDENKPQFAALTEDGEMEAFVLHVMEEDGTEIKQITFNQSHDLFPTLLDDGRLLFLRWDNYLDNKDRLSLYTANPNGSNVNLEYGFHSQNTGTNDSEGVFSKPRELFDARVQVSLRPRISEQLGGGMIAIDTENFTEFNVAVSGSGASGPAQESIVSGNITTDGSASPAGYFNSTYPIDDGTGRLLISWSPCQLIGFKLGIFVDANLQLLNENGQFVDKNANVLADDSNPIVISEDEVGNFPCTEQALTLDAIQLALPVYGLWIFDPSTQTQSPVVLAQQETLYTDALVLQPKTYPNFIADPIPGIDFDQELDEENVGIVHIRSVYDMDGTDISPNGIVATADPLQTSESERPARFIRLMKAVSMADDDVVDFDQDAFAGQGQMKDILGYVPIEPDGSAMFKVPADVAFTFSILDANGKRVRADGSGAIGPRHEYWMSLRAGEVRECSGCHSDDETETPHGRYNAEPESINAGALADAPFPNTQLRDAFGTPHAPPMVGETMAQYYARVNGPRTPSINILDYSDWTEDGTIRPAVATIDYSYSDLRTLAPTECNSSWNSLCRIVINYVEHIQPLWETDRSTRDPDDASVIISDYTCTNCHARIDPNGMPILPAGSGPRQLNLTAEQLEGEDYFVASFVNLFNGIQQREELIFDDEGNVIGIQDEMEPELSDVAYIITQMMLDGVLQYQALDLANNIVPAPSDTIDPDLTLILDINGDLVPYEIYMLDSSGQRVPDPSPSGVQYVYLEIQLSLSGVPQYQAVNANNELVPAPADTVDPNLVLLVDIDNNIIPYQVFELDIDGQRQISYVLTGNNSPSVLSHQGANNSDVFFEVFEPDSAHEGYLNGAELKLIAEWLDIGGQYYNNQFDAP